MKWVMKSRYPSPVYALKKNDFTLMTCTVNTHLKCLRAECGEDRRNFFLEKEKMARYETILRTEYGLIFGNLLFDRVSGNEGSVWIDDQLLRFRIEKDIMSTIHFFKSDHNQPFFSCDLGVPPISLPDQKHSDENYLLFASAWFLSLPVGAKQLVHA
jgi:hypothetical protein